MGGPIDPSPRGACRIVVMGVSGCGKSTMGQLLANALKLRFVEGDALHPPENIARMAAGIPLTDADRIGWLDAIAVLLRTAQAEGRGLVVSCSALKRAYRDRLRGGDPGVLFIHLHGTPELIAQRLAHRPHHYMPASLLPSQLLALEHPPADEPALSADIAEPVDVLLHQLQQRLQACSA